MKKHLSYLMLLTGILISSCKKDAETLNQETYEVKFAVTNFSVAQESFKTASTKAESVKDYADYLYYYVYSKNVLIKTISQPYYMPDFGIIKDNLSPGTYTIVMVAFKGALGFGSTSQLDEAGLFTANGMWTLPDPKEGFWNDTFFKKTTITVSNSNIVQELTLDRIVGGLELVIKDPIPSNISKITLTTMDDASKYFFNRIGYHSYGGVKTKEFFILNSDRGIPNTTLLMHIGNTYSTTRVVLRAYDLQNKLVLERNLPELAYVANKKNIMSGKVFEGYSDLGFLVTVNPNWSTPNMVEF